MIKTVIFDLGKVIVPFDFSRGYRAMSELCSYAPEEIPKRIGSTDLVLRFESGQVSPEQFVEQLCQILDVRMEYGHFCEIWSSIFLPHTLIPENMLEPSPEDCFTLGSLAFSGPPILNLFSITFYSFRYSQLGDRKSVV